MKERITTIKERARGLYTEHKDKVTIKNAGKLVGSVASAVAIPCLKFYDGVREGFNKKEVKHEDHTG
jgi:hypothetical protein